MISTRDLNLFTNIKRDWMDFKVERNKPEYYGKCGPNWLTINEREDYFDNLLTLMERLISKNKGREHEEDNSFGRTNY